MKKGRSLVMYFLKNIGTLIALVMIWRGMWYLLDGIDYYFFGKNHILSSIGGIIVGLLILYLPDKDLKEIQKL